MNLVAGAKPDATVLATHPRLKTKTGKPMPVIVAGEYGKGRSLAFTTDTLWRWGFVAAARPGDDGRQYTKLWENTIRWLIQDPDLRNLHVDSDAVEYVPGAPVRVTVRLLGRDYQPLPNGEVSLVVKRGADPAHRRAGRRRPSSRSARTAPRPTSSAASRPASTASRATPRSPAARSTRATSSSSARAAPSSIARSATRDTLEAIATATGGSALGADRRAARATWRSIRRASSASTAAPMSSCGAAPACCS